MLKDIVLKDSIAKPTLSNKHTIDTEKACNVVDIIFSQINRCIRDDRSGVKLNMLQKGAVQSMLGEKVRNGIKNYIINMRDSDIEELLNSIQKEVNTK